MLIKSPLYAMPPICCPYLYTPPPTFCQHLTHLMDLPIANTLACFKYSTVVNPKRKNLSIPNKTLTSPHPQLDIFVLDAPNPLRINEDLPSGVGREIKLYCGTSHSKSVIGFGIYAVYYFIVNIVTQSLW